MSLLLASASSSISLNCLANGSSLTQITLNVCQAIGCLADGASTASVTLDSGLAVQCLAEGTSTASVTLDLSQAVSCLADGTSTALVALDLSQAIECLADGTSTALVTLDLSQAIECLADGTSTALVTLDLSQAIECLADGTSTALVTLAIDSPAIALQCFADGTSIASVTLQVNAAPIPVITATRPTGGGIYKSELDDPLYNYERTQEAENYPKNRQTSILDGLNDGFEIWKKLNTQVGYVGAKEKIAELDKLHDMKSVIAKIVVKKLASDEIDQRANGGKSATKMIVLITLLRLMAYMYKG